ALLSERLAEHPLLLDELLDARAAGPVPEEGELPALLAQAIASVPAGDTEAALQVLNEHRQAVAFRLALALLGERLAPVDAARRLAALAEAVLAQALQLARSEEHTSELQSRENLVCRLLLGK